MMRLACFFGLIALAALVPMIVNLNGSTAIVFSFIGFPALGLALLLYGVGRWRAGAFRNFHPDLAPPSGGGGR